MAGRAAPAGSQVARLRHLILILGVGAVAQAGSAQAGAWVQPEGRGQAIVKFEDMRASNGLDPTGATAPLPEERRDASLGLFAEYGLTDVLTMQLKADWQDGQDAFVDYEGRGPVELGLTWQAYRDDANAVSLYAGYASGGEGRNAGYASPGAGKHDWEVRGSVGRSMAGPSDGLWPDHMFVEVQAARRLRDGLPDETRLDATVGGRFGNGWMALGQAYGGAADAGARWLSVEASLVRDFGDWSIQAGWRQTVAGRETPLARGPVLAIWRRF